MYCFYLNSFLLFNFLLFFHLHYFILYFILIILFLHLWMNLSWTSQECVKQPNLLKYILMHRLAFKARVKCCIMLFAWSIIMWMACKSCTGTSLHVEVSRLTCANKSVFISNQQRWSKSIDMKQFKSFIQCIISWWRSQRLWEGEHVNF